MCVSITQQDLNTFEISLAITYKIIKRTFQKIAIVASLPLVSAIKQPRVSFATDATLAAHQDHNIINVRTENSIERYQ